MGYGVILDIIGSTIIGGLLLLILVRLGDSSKRNTFNFGYEVTVQANLKSLVEDLEYDLKKIGYCKDQSKIPNVNQAITAADSNSLTFRTDLETKPNDMGDGIPDSIEYTYDYKTDIPSTPNPKDRSLYRITNGTPSTTNLGVTYFKFTYFDFQGNNLGSPVADCTRIYTIQIDIRVESPAYYADPNDKNNTHAAACWRQIRMVSPCLANL